MAEEGRDKEGGRGRGRPGETGRDRERGSETWIYVERLGSVKRA